MVQICQLIIKLNKVPRTFLPIPLRRPISSVFWVWPPLGWQHSAHSSFSFSSSICSSVRPCMFGGKVIPWSANSSISTKLCNIPVNLHITLQELSSSWDGRPWPQLCGSKRGGGVLCPFRGPLGTRLIQCGLRRCLLPYQVASSSIQPFGHNSVGCQPPHRNISTNYYLLSCRNSYSNSTLRWCAVSSKLTA